MTETCANTHDGKPMKQTMLIADGDAELCDAFQRIATERGYEVDTCTDGLDCVRKLRLVTPVVLVLDLDLRWGGGDGVLGWLREEPQFLPGKIVLTAAEASAHIFESLASPPVVKTLTKPFSPSALLNDAAFVASAEPMHPSNGGLRRGILVVDDEPAIRDSLQTLLEHEGFRVWTASSGEEALDQCCDHGEEVAVVLLDVQMPGLDGPRTLEGIREFDADMPVCFIAADTGDHELSDLVRQGARHLFRKPFCMNEIVRVVGNLASKPLRRLQET